LVEQRSPKPPVGGSNPPTPAKFISLGLQCRGGGIGRHAILRGWWAQARRSSNLLLGTNISAEVVQWLERLLAKEEVASSNLVFRSSRSGGIGRRGSLKNCWRATSVSVRARPSAPGNIHIGDTGCRVV
jgi:hypothetical protein